MNFACTSAALLMLTATSAFAADGTFDKMLTVSANPTVSVSTGSGYIHVYPGSGMQVHVIGHVHANPGWFGGDADARVRQIVAAPPITQSGSVVTIGSPHADADLFRNITIDYDLTVPAVTTLRSHTGSGAVEIGGIQTVTADTGSGSIHVDNIGPNAHLDTGSGSIHAANVHGAASLSTGSGSIELAITGPGDVKARTGSGAIHIDGVNGALNAGAGAGSLEISGSPTAEWRLESGSGGIHLKLTNDARFTLNAQTGSGSVQVDRPIVMQGVLGKHHVVGTVNGGGPTIRATTGSGDVSIH